MHRFAVDPAALTIRAGDRAWPFEWDPAAATAAIVLEGRSFELQPLTWRQKCNLARAARKLGRSDDAITVLLPGACLPPRTPLPAGPLERAVLGELVRWLVCDEDEVPWEPAVLGRVAVDVCRWAGMPRQTLDGLPAAEVEAMWSAIQSEARAVQSGNSVAEPVLGEAPPPGYKKIVIVPDPDGDADGAAAAMAPPAPATGNVDAGPRAATSVAPHVDEAAAEPSGGGEPQRAPVAAVQRAPSPVRAASAPATADLRGVAPRSAPRFRVRAPGIAAGVPALATPQRATGPLAPALLRARPAAAGAFHAHGGSARANADAPGVLNQPVPARTTPAFRAGESQAPTAPRSMAMAAARDTAATAARFPSPAAMREADPWGTAPPYDPFLDEADAFGEEDAPACDAAEDRHALADEVESAALDAGIDLEG